MPRGVYTFDAHPLTQPASAAALPSRSTFKTYSLDMWKKDKDVLFLQVRLVGGVECILLIRSVLTLSRSLSYISTGGCFRGPIPLHLPRMSAGGIATRLCTIF